MVQEVIRGAFGFAWIVGLTVWLSAQTPSGAIVGTVRDPAGSVLPGVTITVTGAPLNRPLTATAGVDGTFRFNGVPDGSFTLTAELSGFKRITQTISVSRGARVELPSIRMEIGAGGEPNLEELGLKPDEIPVDFTTSLGRVGLALNRRNAPAETDAFLKRLDAHLYDGGSIDPVLSPLSRDERAVEGLELIEHAPDAGFRGVLMKNDELQNAITRTAIGRVWNFRNSGASSRVVSAIFGTPLAGRTFNPRVTITRASRVFLMAPTRSPQALRDPRARETLGSPHPHSES